jgi:hypothetical protein
MGEIIAAHAVILLEVPDDGPRQRRLGRMALPNG